MAPVGINQLLVGFSSLEVGLISLVVFFILCIIFVTLCIQCQRKSGNAYDMSGTTTDGAGGPNGAVGTNLGEGLDSSLSWRSHTVTSEMSDNQDKTRATTK